MKRLLILIFVCILVVSCKEKKKTTDVFSVKTIKSPALAVSMQPFLFSNDGTLFMSYTQQVNDSVYTLKFSSLAGNKWTAPTEIANGKDWFVNWADFPAIAVNKPNMMAHFLQKSDPATFAYDVHATVSNDNGKHWNDDFILYTDSTKTEHGFVTMLPYKNDSFFVTWLDGRNTGSGSHGEEHSSSGAMNIRTATVLPSGEVIEDTLVDDKTCDCCQTGAAITPNGPIIVYRNRTDDEVRDIYISRWVAGSWTSPMPINNDHWVINGCPVNGPKAASFENTLAVAWFTAADNTPKVNLAFSKDNGAHFNAPIQIDNGKPIGRVDVAFLDAENVLVSWMESTDTDAELKVVKVGLDGIKQKDVTITALSGSRKSGFPQLEIVNNTVYMAWNDITQEETTIKTVSIPDSAF